MDVQTGLIGLVIVVILPVVVYFISVLGIKEKTYEEALAEQRQLQQRLDDQWTSTTTTTTGNSSTKSKDNKRNKRLVGRKSKEKSGHGGLNEEHHVGFKTEPEIIPTDDDDDNDNDEDEEKVKKVDKVNALTATTKKSDEPRSILVRKDKSPPVLQFSAKPMVVAAAKNNNIGSVSPIQVKNKQPKATSKVELGIVKAQLVVPVNKEKTQKIEDQLDRYRREASSKTSKESKDVKESKEVKEAKDTKESKDVKEPKGSKEFRDDKNSKEPKQIQPTLSSVSNRQAVVDGAQKSISSVKELAQSVASKPKITNGKEIKRNAPTAERVSLPANRKLGAKRAKYDDDAVSCNRITSLLNAAVLSESELQSLIELLLNRQQWNRNATATDNEWLRAGQRIDTLSALRKQLIERDQLLSEERNRSQANVQKLRQVRLELQTEKQRSIQTEKLSNEMKQEIQLLQTQQSQLNSVNRKLNEQIQQTNNALHQSQSKFDAIVNEKRTLTDKLDEFETMLTMSKSDVDRLLIEQRQLIERIGNEKYNYEQSVVDLNRNLLDIEQKRLSEVSSIESRLVTSEADRTSINKRLVEMQTILSSQEVVKQQLDSMVVDLQLKQVEIEKQANAFNLQLHDERTTCHSLEKQISSLKEENEMLALQLSHLSERQEAEGRESSNGSDNSMHQSSIVDKTNGHIEYEQKNGDQTKILLLEHETILHEKEKLVDQLSHEIKDLSDVVSTATDEIQRLVQEVDVQKTKNNALREKNWKAMEALNLAEKSVTDKVKSIEQTLSNRLRSEHQSIETVFKRSFPSFRMNTSNDDWMSNFEEQLIVIVNEKKTKNSDFLTEIERLRSKLSTSDENIVRLQAEVQHFKTVLAETEGILNRLQSSVEAEESQWSDKMDAKEIEIEKLRDDKRVLMDKLEEVTVAQQTVAEMAAKLQLLKQDLNEAAEVERRLLESERDQARVLVEQVNAQLTDVKNRVQLLTDERDLLLSQVDEWRIVADEYSQLKQSNKELTGEVVKLNGQLKIGVDALKAEQQLVLELTDKLEGSVTANGSSEDQIKIQIPVDDQDEVEVDMCASSSLTLLTSRSLDTANTKNNKRSKAAKNRQRIVSANN